MNNDNTDNKPLSDDPEENLRMENELLRLKLQAELGARSQSEGSIDPEIENQFLKNILAFEQNHARSKPKKIYDLLGKPDFERAADLSDEQIDIALQRITDLLAEKSIEVYFGDDYDSRTQYHFITEELFEHESNFPSMPGMTTHFDYEEFHPNNKKDIQNRAEEFLNEWFKQSFTDYSWELADQFVLPDRRVLGKKDILAQMKIIFDAYSAFTDEKFIIKDVGFQLDGYTGLGHAEGLVKYKAVLEDGGSVEFEGPFKLYMTREQQWWSIFHIIFPGFKYD